MGMRLPVFGYLKSRLPLEPVRGGRFVQLRSVVRRTVLMARKEQANLSHLQKMMQAKLQVILDPPLPHYTGQRLRS
ncbi:MAG: hypothetical protein EBW88_10100 [Betaproteobacteria bacterium]|nr:hypothetical protein [Betaproteobacteria bacterium]